MQAGPCCRLSPQRPKLSWGFIWVFSILPPSPAQGAEQGTGRVGGAEPHDMTFLGDLLFSSPL